MNYDNLIVDGNNFLFRAFYSKKEESPISQCLYMLKSLADRYNPKNIYFTWDKRLNTNAVNFRRTILKEYKENRIETGEKLEVLSYIKDFQLFCDALGIKTIFPYDLEGDDVMYYLSQQLKGISLLISSDRDLLQMVSENIHQLIPTKNIIVNLDNFEEFTGVSQDVFILYKAILGDKSDNIAGLFRYGEVKAKALALRIKAEGLDQVTLSDESKEIIKNNIKIIDLKLAKDERPTEFEHYDRQIKDTESNEFCSDTLIELFSEYNLNYYLREIGTWKKLFSVKEKDSKEWWNDALSLISM